MATPNPPKADRYLSTSQCADRSDAQSQSPWRTPPEGTARPQPGCADNRRDQNRQIERGWSPAGREQGLEITAQPCGPGTAKTYETISLRRHCPGQVLEVAVTFSHWPLSRPAGLRPEISPRSRPRSGSLARPAGTISMPATAAVMPGPKVPSSWRFPVPVSRHDGQRRLVPIAHRSSHARTSRPAKQMSRRPGCSPPAAVGGVCVVISGWMQLCGRRRWCFRLRGEPLHDQPYRQDYLLHADGEVEHCLCAGEQSDGLEEDQQSGGETQNGAGPGRGRLGMRLRARPGPCRRCRERTRRCRPAPWRWARRRLRC